MNIGLIEEIDQIHLMLKTICLYLGESQDRIGRDYKYEDEKVTIRYSRVFDGCKCVIKLSFTGGNGYTQLEVFGKDATGNLRKFRIGRWISYVRCLYRKADVVRVKSGNKKIRIQSKSLYSILPESVDKRFGEEEEMWEDINRFDLMIIEA